MPSNAIQVVAGIISNEKGDILLAKRPAGSYQGGLWEFPGGKQEQYEETRTALERELMEELGLKVKRARPFIKLYYEYPEKSVVLNVWLIQEWEGVPCGKEGQAVEWYNRNNLNQVEILPANETIIRAIQLPSLYLISPGPAADRLNEFVAGIEESVAAGARLLQLRCHEEFYRTHPEVVEKVLAICTSHNAKLLLNTIPTTAVSLNAHGVHLNSVRLLQLNERPLDRSFWVSASCHNRMELEHAERIGVDFAVLSPVEYTTSHPDAVPMGWEKFSGLVDHANIPIYALGGMLPTHMHTAWKCGAQGIAMLSGVWSSSRPAEVIRECINA
jgi:8-oxo-dGTP diphosphatase